MPQSPIDLLTELLPINFFVWWYKSIGDYITNEIEIIDNMFFRWHFSIYESIDNYTSNGIRLYTSMEYFIVVLLSSSEITKVARIEPSSNNWKPSGPRLLSWTQSLEPFDKEK